MLVDTKILAAAPLRLFAAGTGVMVSIHAVLGLETDMVHSVDASAAYIVAVASGYSLCVEHGKSSPGDIFFSYYPPTLTAY